MLRRILKRAAPAGFVSVAALIASSAALAVPAPVHYGSSATVPDPTTLGPLTPVNADYSDGTVQLGTDAENFPVRISGDVWYPAGGSGPYPLIVFLHGQHEYCQFNDPTGISGGSESGAPGELPGTVSAVFQTAGDEFSTYDDGQCTSEIPLGLATATEIDSYAGYDYIGKELASDGYVVFSIDVNDISSLDESADDASYIGRAQLVAKTLDFVDALDLGKLPLNPLSMALEGRIDMSRIGLMGHSRGGQGMNMFAVYDQNRPATYAEAEAEAVPQGHEDYGPSYPISGLFSLAPVDGQGSDPRDSPTPVGMPYAVLLPLCDGDVFDLEGDPPFERAKYLNSAAGYPTIEYAVNGADHDFFNTEWSDDDADPLTGGIGFGTEDEACGNEEEPNRLSRTEERAVGSTLIDAFMRYFVGGEHEFAPIVDGAAFPAAECPAARLAGLGVTCDTVVETSYIAPQSERLDLVHPDSASVLPTSTSSGQPVTFTGFDSATACTPTAGEEDLTTSGCGSSPNRARTPQLDLAWDGPALMSMSMGASGTDISGYSDFTMRAATDYLSALNAPGVEQDFEVVLKDTAGHSSAVDVEPYSPALIPSPGTISRKVVLTGIRIPLTAFTGVDLHHISMVELSFGSSSPTGEIQVADIGFTDLLSLPPGAPSGSGSGGTGSGSGGTGSGSGGTGSGSGGTGSGSGGTGSGSGGTGSGSGGKGGHHPSPPRSVCPAYKRFTFVLHYRKRIVQVTLTIGRHRVLTVRGRRLRSVSLRRKTSVAAVRVLMVARFSNGSTVTTVRTIRGCVVSGFRTLGHTRPRHHR